ncbi:MAG: hypothetical protein M0Q91_07595 [Methanoregula sp.]|nr:hypothetical protein [Methanoregula sp.]
MNFCFPTMPLHPIQARGAMIPTTTNPPPHDHDWRYMGIRTRENRVYEILVCSVCGEEKTVPYSGDE